jgi:arylsulfatase
MIQNTDPLTKKRDDDLDGRRRHAVPRRKGDQLGGGFRVPTFIRWPGVIKPGTIFNDICAQGIAAKGIPHRSDDGDVFAIRYNRWKIVFVEQNHEGIDIWARGFDSCGCQRCSTFLPTHLSGDKSFLYNRWLAQHAPINYGGVALVLRWLQSFKEFPPRQKPASFNLDEVMRKISEPPGSN